MKFIARPAEIRGGREYSEELLADHLRVVAEAARDYLIGPWPEFDKLSQMAWVAGATHDFGKYTTFFQEKLPPLEKTPPKPEYTHHAPVSALLGAYVCRQRWPEDPMAALLAFLAIWRHHGALVNPDILLPDKRQLRDNPFYRRMIGGIKVEYEAIAAQIANMRGEHKDQIISEMRALGVPEVEDFLSGDVISGLMRDLYGAYMELFFASEDPQTMRTYWHALLLFSALIDADKHISSRIGLREAPRYDIPYHLVERYVQRMQQENQGVARAELLKIRDSVFQESTRFFEENPLENLFPGLFSLTAPTGSGKTLAVLGAALKLRERLRDTTGWAPRIIYALPFTNIIEQNHEVIQKVLSELPEYSKDPMRYLIKHHHLATIQQRSGSEEDVPTEEQLLLVESWDSEIIVTTFVQLLESLVTNSNRRLKKLHNIAGSIIILDEIQNIPYEQWRLVHETITTLSQYLGCTVVQMTATRPRILPEAREVLPQPDKYFGLLDRTQIVPRADVRSLEDLQDLVLELGGRYRSVLVILNTIPSAVSFYQQLASWDSMEGYREPSELERSADAWDRYWDGYSPEGRMLVHLSTNVVPWQRRHRVAGLARILRHRKDELRPIVVSTQVVEAGVDLDFDVVVRDHAPLDSIVQAAGRCNRSWAADDHRPVYVVGLRDERERHLAERIYGRVLTRKMEELLSSPKSEPELYADIEQYFALLPNLLTDDEYRAYIWAMHKLNFRGKEGEVSVSQYRHIEEMGEAYPVIVELGEIGRMALERLLEAREAYARASAAGVDEKLRARTRLRESYNRLGEFVISPYAHRLLANTPPKHPEIEGHFYISMDDLPEYYDLETGFRLDKLGDEAVML